MLELYRASAGSGKTYTLAKKYIWYYLTITPEGEATRLRTESELGDSATHILAVTFTNKATNEMQQRIVEALYDLSRLRRKEKILPDGTIQIINPDYLDDFCKQLGVSEQELARTATTGLSVLLENYSTFNVSTIDSFFQTVLRTFAYESELNDSYQVELDGKFLSQLGVDATLDEIDANPQDSTTHFWIRTLIERTRKGKWNIFAGRESDTATNAENPYGDFIDSVGRMENEQFKAIRRDIETYFEEYGDQLPVLYKELQKKYEKPVKEAFRELLRSARRARANQPDELKNAGSRADLGKFDMYYRDLADPVNSKLKWDTDIDSGKIPEFKESVLEGKKWNAYSKSNPEAAETVEKDLRAVQGAVAAWTALTGSPEFRHWMLYAQWLPYFALFSIVSRKRREYLEENNAVELAETSMILQSVIGDSDAPFIYERLGTRLNHFLIDEFQDTSSLQWKILSPLLHESMGHIENYGNLIIGDAKQSIYRFRNADPSLITRVVPDEFRRYEVTERGNIPSENTNYRSDLRVVQFNNSFFKYLAGQMDKGKPAERQFFEALYSNVVQRPNRKTASGYIEVHVTYDRDPEAPGIEEIPRLIVRLLERGYQQREIAVLVEKHSQGEEVIKALTEYNNALGEEESGRRLSFVSEQSLKVDSSQAVKVITGVLENMARGSNPQMVPTEERRKKGVCNWREHEANFKFFTLEHANELRGKENAAKLDAYIENGAAFDALSDLMERMQSYALPSVVEAVTARFVDNELKKSDGVYIAAFQDLVLEYCEGHPTDIGSFLKWWERKRKSASIASPEDVDAVQIITVHKSKGLQYECVILPYANWKFSDESVKKSEWRWVKPMIDSGSDIPLPPYLPVGTSERLSTTSHAPLLTEYYDQVRMDRLNAAYVALTRAKNELYIFSKTSKKGEDGSFALYMMAFLKGTASGELRLTTAPPDTNPNRDTEEEDHLSLLSAGEIRIVNAPESSMPFEAFIGIPADSSEIGRDRKRPAEITPLEGYPGVESPASLKYRLEELDSLADASSMENANADDLDIRSEGTLKHKVLEYVKVASDIPDAVRHLVINGLLPSSLAASIEEDLREAVSRQEVAEWFDGTARVLNERAVLKRGEVTRRPDRLLLYPDGHVVVVDYKFGKIPENNENNKNYNQISHYVELLRETGHYPSVEGYLWYVNQHTIIPVE